ncbi:hypothetical protein Slin15195_G085720 [Septoria linicola]|uniref:Xylanolytic transcriptional activator regulatory domain-containing protein n=1 Tax=Septoria linicola TaxID=215465 RepID=A0A9Q9AXY4_9PEZI|nr:hypothetical protein Slin14017_G088310 [Septoria linicola]USW55253.1 hypothetical protein Slin15195_G085720 [Septoria linicola]
MGSRLDPDEGIRATSVTFATRAKAAIHFEIDNICLATIQACILLANIFAADLEPSLETLYFGIATRMAQIMGLHRANDDTDVVQRETRARVWYALVTSDIFCNTNLGLPRQIHILDGDVALPGDEAEFQLLLPGSREPRSSSLGMWAYCTRLFEMFGAIHDLNRQIVDQKIAPQIAEECVRGLAMRLDEWRASLPQLFEETEINLEKHIQRGTGGLFVAFHLGYHHYSTLLYFRYLGTASTNTATQNDYADQCRVHAASFASLVRKSRAAPGSEAQYATVGHMAVVSSSVILHTLLFDSSEQISGAKADLTSNFAALLELKKFWPCLERTMGRLLVFRNHCLQAKTSDVHRIDHWMLRYLVEHSLPLEDSDPSRPGWHEVARAGKPDADRSSREGMANEAPSTLWHKTPP